MCVSVWCIRLSGPGGTHAFIMQAGHSPTLNSALANPCPPRSPPNQIPIVVLFHFWQAFACSNPGRASGSSTAYSGTRISTRSSSRSGTRSARQLEEVVDKKSERGATLEEWFDDDEEVSSLPKVRVRVRVRVRVCSVLCSRALSANHGT